MNKIKIGSHIEVDLDSEPNQSHGEKALLHRVLAQLKHNEKKQKKRDRKIMIAIDSLNASATRLEAGVHTIIGLLPGNTVPSTPDSDVAGFQGRVDGASAALEAAIATASSGGTPPPPPAP